MSTLLVLTTNPITQSCPVHIWSSNPILHLATPQPPPQRGQQGGHKRTPFVPPRILRATFHFVISRRGSECVRRTLDILPPPNERGGPKNLRRLDLEGRGCLARPLRARPLTRRLARVVLARATGTSTGTTYEEEGGRGRADERATKGAGVARRWFAVSCAVHR